MLYKIFQYRIQGSLRPTLLVLEWFIALIFLEIGFGFIIRIRSSKKKFLADNIEKGFMCIAFGYSAMWIFIIIANYYIYSSQLQDFLINLSFFMIILGTFFFLYFNEKVSILFYKKYFLTKSYSFLVIGYVFIFFILADYTAYYMFLSYPFFFICFTSYIKKMGVIFVKEEYLGKYRVSLLLFFIGIILLLIGYALTTEILDTLFKTSLEIRLLGDILEIIAIILLILFLCLIPSLAEYEWKRMIDAVIVMHKGGLPIYNKYLNKEVDALSGSLISGSLTILKKLLEQTSADGGTSVIEQQGKTLIFQPGNYIYGVLICDESLESLQQLLKVLVDRIEKIYKDFLKHWKGDLTVFAPVKKIVKDLFDI
ncbi:MAG: hypothetical protein ACTSR8_11475 [Promethearchaeota archaeon]